MGTPIDRGRALQKWIKETNPDPWGLGKLPKEWWDHNKPLLVSTKLRKILEDSY